MGTPDNYIKLTNVIASWLKPKAMTLLSQQQTVTSINEFLRGSAFLKSFVNYLGLNLMNYNVVDELSFLITPILNNIGYSVVPYLKKIAPEERIIPVALDVVSAAQIEAQQKGNVNIFGITLNFRELEELHQAIKSIETK